MTEQEAIRRLQQDDIGGLELLVRRYQLRAVKAATLVTHDVALAQEVVQSAFLRFYERVDQFDITRPFAPYFLRIVVNDAIKAAKREQREIRLESLVENGAVDLSEILSDARPGPAEQLTASLLRDNVWEALGRLTPKQRAAIVLRYYLGMSEAEMAEELAIKPGTVKWRLHVARERLRELLSQQIA